MALTRPSFNNINTTTAQAYFTDTLVTLNYGNVTANNQDVGFVINRGSSSNVALVWSEATKGFVLAQTTASGLVGGNIAITANANLRVGNLEVSGTTTHTGSITGTDLTLSGNLTVNGATVTVNATTLTVNDKNIVVANNQTTSSGIDGSGIDAGGSTPIATWRYNHATTSWQSNVGITPAANNSVSLGGSSNYWNTIYATNHYGTIQTASQTNITGLGNIITGTWSASTVGVLYGGTGATTASAARTNLGVAIGSNVQAWSATLDTVTSGTYTGTSTITTLGSISTGTWNGNVISTAKGGTGLTGFTVNGAVYATSASALTTGTLPVVSGGTGTTTSTGSGSVVLSTSPTLTGTTVAATINAATIGNSGATLIGTTANISGNATLAGNVINGNVFATGYFYANGFAFTGGSGGSPGGGANQLQYNSTGTFAGAAGLTTDGSNLTIGSQGDLRFADSDTTHWVAFQAPATISANVTWTLPAADGSANQALVTNGSGTLSWAAAGAAITNDTSTAALYPSMATATSGYLTDARVSSTKFAFNASTGTISTVALNAATIGNTGASLVGTVSTATQNSITTMTGLTGFGTAGVATTASGDLTVSGNLLVNGTTVTINATTVTTNDKNIVVANNQTTSSGIDGAGIDAGGGTPIATWRYNNSTTSWQSNVSVTPAANNTLSLGGASNYWTNIYATTHTGTTGTFSGTVSAATINAATIGNASAAHTGATMTLTSTLNVTGTATLNAVSANTTVSATGNVSGGNLTTSGQLSAATAAITTSITRNSRNVPTYVASASAPSSPLQGDFWYNSNSDTLYQYIYDGTNSQWVDQTPPSTFANLTVSGNPVFTGYITVNGANNASAIVNAGTTGVGNVGSSTGYFNTIFAKATSAQYADLAEKYLADDTYLPGTVVVFGGTSEITVSDISHDTRVAGVISTDPAFIMNDGLENGLPVAFTGRVPCLVQGPVTKGDRLVNIGAGVAGKMDPELYEPGCIIGKSLETINTTDIRQIEVVVGRY